MLGRAAFFGTALAALTVALLSACDRPSTTPTPPATPTPPVTGAPVMTRIELVAPRTLAPGATAQLRVVATLSDNSTRDVTASAVLRSDRPDILAISPDGGVTALKLGHTFVHAQSDWLTSGREVIVLPDGTFRLAGQVFEDDAPSEGVVGAIVEADGVPRFMTALGGHYVFYGVGSHTRIRVSKLGYVTKELILDLSDHHTQNFTLALAQPRHMVAGTYRMTVEASPACRGQIPDTVTTRHYAAEITQDGPLIRAVLTGARFQKESGNAAIWGRVDPTGFFLDLKYAPPYSWYDEFWELVEVIDDATYFVVLGRAALVPASTGYTGSLNGSFEIHQGPPRGDTPPQSRCSSSSHRLTLTR